MQMHQWLVVALFAAGAMACDGSITHPPYDGPEPAKPAEEPAPATSYRLERVTGVPMFASIGARMTTLPAVRALDRNGNPAAGQIVRFTRIEGGGSIEGASVTTGSDGLARLQAWSLGSQAGINSILVVFDTPDSSPGAKPTLYFTTVGVKSGDQIMTSFGSSALPLSTWGGKLLGAMFSFNGSNFEHTYFFEMDAATGSISRDLNYGSYRQVGNDLTFYDDGDSRYVGGVGTIDQNRLTFYPKSYSWVLAPSVESYVAW